MTNPDRTISLSPDREEEVKEPSWKDDCVLTLWFRMMILVR